MTISEIIIGENIKAEVSIERKQIAVIPIRGKEDNMAVEVIMSLPCLLSRVNVDAVDPMTTMVLFRGAVEQNNYYSGGGGDFHRVEVYDFSEVQHMLIPKSHTGGKKPSVTIVNNVGEEIIGYVKYLDNGDIYIELNSPATGEIYLN